MRKWIWRTLLLTAALAALTVGALAADSNADITAELDNGVTLTLKDNKNWEVTSYTPKEDESSEETGVVVIPALYKEKPVMTISPTAFAKSTKLLKITIPGTVKEIPEKAFENCTNLNTVTFQDYVVGENIEGRTTIGAGAFKGCTVLSNLVLSCSIENIELNAFNGCASLRHVIIPRYVRSIGTSAFDNCNYLEDVTFLSPFTKAEKSFAYDSPSLTTIHCLKGSVMDTFLTSKKIDHHIITCEDKVNTSASCKAEGSIQVSFTCTYKEEITEEVKGEDGKPTGETKVTGYKYCTVYGEKANSETRVTSKLPHRSVEDPATDAVDCQHPAKGPGSHCSVCGTVIDEPETLENGPHKYTVETTEELFKSTCTEDGLIRITKVCSVCGASPTCYLCDECEKALDDAKDAAKEKQEALDKAIAENNKAIGDYTKASNDLKAAEDALTAAEDARTEAITNFAKAAKQETPPTTVEGCESVFASIKTSYEEAQKAVQEKQDEIEGLQEDIADLEKELETAEEADKAGIEAQIEGKKTALKTAEDALEPLKTAAAEEKEKWDPVNAAHTVVLTAKVAYESAGNAKKRAESAEQTAASAKSAAETALEEAKTNYNDSSDAIEIAKKNLAKHTTEEKHKEKETDTKELEDGLIYGKVIPKSGHQWLEPPYVKPDENNKIPDCVTGSAIILPLYHTCEVCGEEEATGENKVIEPAGSHVRPANTEGTVKTPATCTEPGIMVYDYECETCHAKVTGEEGPIPAKGHDYQPVSDYKDPNDKPATCTEDGRETTGIEKCKDCGELNPDSGKVTIIPATGHEWGNFKVTEGTEKQAHPCQEGTAMGTATCTVCGHSSGTIEIVLPATAPHTWGAWTPSEDGKTETRTCTVCGEKDERAVTVPDNPDDPDDPDNPDKPDEPDKPDPDASYTITLVQGTGGRVTASRSSAKAGTTVTITVTPESGYELDMVRVIGDTTAEDLTGGRRSFTMPASNVKVQASFARIASGAGWGGVSSSSGRTDPARTQELLPTQITSPASTPWAGTGNQLYWDIPTSHWAAGEINWANQMGYMSGSGGRFDPDGTITGQQVWMVMARLMGTFPANMAEARRWAVETGFATGSSPERAMTRHQVVTALYRCAILRGRASRPSGLTLAGYADSSLVPAVARDAMIWAVSNGIVTGDSSNRLNPTGTITRAQFAVLLYRFSQRV